MRIRPKFFGLLIGLWGIVIGLLGLDATPGGCPLGSCPACGACFLNKEPAVVEMDETRVV